MACIGNGPSRLRVDLESVRSAGWMTIGCNALWRDFLPDAIVAVDADISREIMTECPTSVLRMTHQDLAGHPNDRSLPLLKEVRNACADSAGVASVAAAICLGASRLLLIGHDLDDSGSIYMGTKNTAKKRPSYVGTVMHWRRTLEAILGTFDGPVETLTPTPLPVPTKDAP